MRWRELKKMDKIYTWKECKKSNVFSVQDDKVRLRILCPEDKEDYFSLYQETSIVKKAMKTEEFREFFESQWKEMELNNEELNITILAQGTGEYAGNIRLNNLSSDTPEVGVDICSKYRRQGIAYQSLRLFKKMVSDICGVAYYLVRIYSDNEASQGLFRKLGAVEIGKEPSEYQRFLNVLREELGNEEYEKIKTKNPDMEKIAGSRYIKRYRLDVKHIS